MNDKVQELISLAEKKGLRASDLILSGLSVDEALEYVRNYAPKHGWVFGFPIGLLKGVGAGLASTVSGLARLGEVALPSPLDRPLEFIAEKVEGAIPTIHPETSLAEKLGYVAGQVGSFFLPQAGVSALARGLGRAGQIVEKTALPVFFGATSAEQAYRAQPEGEKSIPQALLGGAITTGAMMLPFHKVIPDKVLSAIPWIGKSELGREVTRHAIQFPLITAGMEAGHQIGATGTIHPEEIIASKKVLGPAEAIVGALLGAGMHLAKPKPIMQEGIKPEEPTVQEGVKPEESPVQEWIKPEEYRSDMTGVEKPQEEPRGSMGKATPEGKGASTLEWRLREKYINVDDDVFIDRVRDAKVNVLNKILPYLSSDRVVETLLIKHPNAIRALHSKVLEEALGRLDEVAMTDLLKRSSPELLDVILPHIDSSRLEPVLANVPFSTIQQLKTPAFSRVFEAFLRQAENNPEKVTNFIITYHQAFSDRQLGWVLREGINDELFRLVFPKLENEIVDRLSNRDLALILNRVKDTIPEVKEEVGKVLSKGAKSRMELVNAIKNVRDRLSGKKVESVVTEEEAVSKQDVSMEQPVPKEELRVDEISTEGEPVALAREEAPKDVEAQEDILPKIQELEEALVKGKKEKKSGKKKAIEELQQVSGGEVKEAQEKPIQESPIQEQEKVTQEEPITFIDKVNRELLEKHTDRVGKLDQFRSYLQQVQQSEGSVKTEKGGVSKEEASSLVTTLQKLISAIESVPVYRKTTPDFGQKTFLRALDPNTVNNARDAVLSAILEAIGNRFYPQYKEKKEVVSVDEEGNVDTSTKKKAGEMTREWKVKQSYLDEMRFGIGKYLSAILSNYKKKGHVPEDLSREWMEGFSALHDFLTKHSDQAHLIPIDLIKLFFEKFVDEKEPETFVSRYIIEQRERGEAVEKTTDEQVENVSKEEPTVQKKQPTQEEINKEIEKVLEELLKKRIDVEVKIFMKANPGVPEKEAREKIDTPENRRKLEKELRPKAISLVADKLSRMEGFAEQEKTETAEETIQKAEKTTQKAGEATQKVEKTTEKAKEKQGSVKAYAYDFLGVLGEQPGMILGNFVEGALGSLDPTISRQKYGSLPTGYRESITKEGKTTYRVRVTEVAKDINTVATDLLHKFFPFKKAETFKFPTGESLKDVVTFEDGKVAHPIIQRVVYEVVKLLEENKKPLDKGSIDFLRTIAQRLSAPGRFYSEILFIPKDLISLHNYVRARESGGEAEIPSGYLLLGLPNLSDAIKNARDTFSSFLSKKDVSALKDIDTIINIPHSLLILDVEKLASTNSIKEAIVDKNVSVHQILKDFTLQVFGKLKNIQDKQLAGTFFDTLEKNRIDKQKYNELSKVSSDVLNLYSLHFLSEYVRQHALRYASFRSMVDSAKYDPTLLKDPFGFLQFFREVVGRAVGEKVDITLVDPQSATQFFDLVFGFRPLGFAMKLSDRHLLGAFLDGRNLRVEDAITLGHELFHLVEPRISETDRKLLFQRYKNVEEIADAFGRYLFKQYEPPSFARRVFDMMRELWDRIVNLIKGNGFRSSEDIFDKIVAGEYATKNPKDVPLAYFVDAWETASRISKDFRNSEWEVAYRQKLSQDTDKSIIDHLKKVSAEVRTYIQGPEKYPSIFSSIINKLEDFFSTPVFHPFLSPIVNGYKRAQRLITDRVMSHYETAFYMKKELQRRDPRLYDTLRKVIIDSDLIGTYQVELDKILQEKYGITSPGDREAIIRTYDAIKDFTDRVLITDLHHGQNKVIYTFRNQVQSLRDRGLIDEEMKQGVLSAVADFDSMLKDILYVFYPYEKQQGARVLINDRKGEIFDGVRDFITKVMDAVRVEDPEDILNSYIQDIEIKLSELIPNKDAKAYIQELEGKRLASKTVEAEINDRADLSPQEKKWLLSRLAIIRFAIINAQTALKSYDVLSNLPSIYYFPRVRSGGNYEIRIFYKYFNPETDQTRYIEIAYHDTTKDKSDRRQYMDLVNLKTDLMKEYLKRSTQKQVQLIDTADAYAKGETVADFVNRTLLQNPDTAPEYIIAWGRKAPKDNPLIYEHSPSEIIAFLRELGLKTDDTFLQYQFQDALSQALAKMYADINYAMARKMVFSRVRLPEEVKKQTGHLAIMGFKQDLFDVFNEYAIRMQGNLTNNVFLTEVLRLTNDPRFQEFAMRNPEIKELIDKQIDLYLSPNTNVANAVYKTRALISFMYLGFRLSVALLNNVNFLVLFLPEYLSLKKVGVDYGIKISSPLETIPFLKRGMEFQPAKLSLSDLRLLGEVKRDFTNALSWLSKYTKEKVEITNIFGEKTEVPIIDKFSLKINLEPFIEQARQVKDPIKQQELARDLFILMGLKRLISDGSIESSFYHTLRQEGMHLFGKTANQIFDTAFFAFRGSERFIRTLSAIMALNALYDRAVYKKLDKIAGIQDLSTVDQVLRIVQNNPNLLQYEVVSSLLDRTYFRYDRLNRHWWTNPAKGLGAILSIPTTLRGFSFNYLSSLFTWAKDKEWTKLAMSLTALLLLGGVTSLPLVDNLLDTYERLTGEPIKLKTYKELKKYFGGEDIADIITRGLPALAVDMSTSLKTELPFLPKSLDFQGFAEAFFGIQKDLMTRWLEKAPEAYKSGDYLGALTFLAPLGIGMPIQAYQLYTEGLKTKYGSPVIDYETGEPVKLTESEAILRTLGFRPINLAKTQDERYLASRLISRLEKEKTRLYERLRRASSSEEYNKVIDDIIEFNQKIAEYGVAVSPITPMTIKRALSPKKDKVELLRRDLLGVDKEEDDLAKLYWLSELYRSDTTNRFLD